MKRILLALIIAAGLFSTTVNGQNNADYSKIDIMLLHAEYNKAIDTCKQVLAIDSLNSEIYYKMGLAYQNILPDDKSFDCFLNASRITPDNNQYKFMVAKSLFNKSKNNQARPLLESLCMADSMNWTYAYYLTSIYLQEGKYDKSLKIYNRFYNQDSINYIYLDKIGFAYLRKGALNNAIDFFNRSLAVNKKNNNAIKNLSYLYANSNRIDTAIQLLGMGIANDPTDMDLYARRAAIHFSINYNKRALNDYLKILSSGDSSFLYLKRAGIGYFNNFQPEEAIAYLLIASKKDSTDYETLDYLARSYTKLKNLKKSEEYYYKIIKILTPVAFQLELTYLNLGEEYKADGQYKKAITSYLTGQRFGPDLNIDMIIANIYDENIKDIPKAIHYYQLFLDGVKPARKDSSSENVDKDIKAEPLFGPEYIKSIQDRVDFLKEKQKQPQPVKKK